MGVLPGAAGGRSWAQAAGTLFVSWLPWEAFPFMCIYSYLDPEREGSALTVHSSLYENKDGDENTPAQFGGESGL